MVRFLIACFRRKPEILLSPWSRCCRRRHAKTLTFCEISVITEDIYFKLGISVHYPKNNPCYQGRQFKMQFGFQNYVPFSTLTFYPLSSTQQPSVGTRMRCSLSVRILLLSYNKPVSNVI